ncbi:MAG: hypothetical protein JW719_14570 [Pirellulales bacterium]|nr:hypothetical protein [Pirellulales bacterium]
MSASPLRGIPSIHELLENPTLKTLAERLHPGAVLSTVRMVLDEVGTEVHNAATEKALPSVSELADRISRRLLEVPVPPLARAVNATGVLLHPELGSPPWADAAVEAMVAATGGYATGRAATGPRGDGALARRRVAGLAGAEDALILCSASAATAATLAAVAGPRAVVVARRDVIRRGADYDLCELAELASVWLREVGAANDARIDDYRRAVDDEAGAILLVRRTDAAAEGSDSGVGLGDLIHLTREKRLAVIHDLGPASLVDLSSFGVEWEPRVNRRIEAGADLVLFGHEMLGGPSCGIVAGRRSLIERIEHHALARASRAGEADLAALAATLELMQSPDEARRAIPLLQLVCASSDNLKNRAERMAPQMAAAKAVARAEVVASQGSLLGDRDLRGTMAGWSVALHPLHAQVDQMADALRRAEPAVVGLPDGDRLLLNLRSVPAADDLHLVEAVAGLDGPA